MAEIRIRKRKGVFSIWFNGTKLNGNKDIEFVKGWLNNQIRDFKNLYIEL